MKNLFAIVAGFAVAASASAGVFTGWDVTIQLGDNTPWSVVNQGVYQMTQTANPDGSTTYVVTGSDSNANRTFGWDVEIIEVPAVAGRGGSGALFVSSSFSITNNTGVIQPFNVQVNVPGSLSGPNVMRGSVSGSVGDGDGALDIFGAGGTVQTQMYPNPGARPYYAAIIDGVDVRDLYAAPSRNQAPQFGTADIDTQSFMNEPAPAVAGFVGIRNSFMLTSRDNAQFTSTFVVVPTPGALAIAGIAGLVGLRRRR